VDQTWPGKAANWPDIGLCSCYVLQGGYLPPMPDADKFTPADPRDLADAIAFSLRFESRRRVHNADEYIAAIAAERVVRHLERLGFVVMKRPSSDRGRGARKGFKKLVVPDSAESPFPVASREGSNAAKSGRAYETSASAQVLTPT
jgi:hypothetical protein